MPSAYILINADLGTETQIIDNIKDLKGIKEAYTVYGVYDIIAKAESESLDKLKLIIENARKLPKVRSTLTMIVM
jgi:DNA-binding Lrp family transcriptional regulator|tara:strand:+ start:1916 stop:2140 length:225 start_codon:yes stop_codon:yes gene_type:complete